MYFIQCLILNKHLHLSCVQLGVNHNGYQKKNVEVRLDCAENVVKHSYATQNGDYSILLKILYYEIGVCALNKDTIPASIVNTIRRVYVIYISSPCLTLEMITCTIRIC